MFSQELNDAILEKNSRLCVGLDPRLEMLPESILQTAIQNHGKTQKAAAEALISFHTEVLNTIAPHAACVKLQSAFFEVFGAPGIEAFWTTAALAKELGIPVIADIKRGDIDSTATAYAQAYLGGNNFWGEDSVSAIDAVTVNPFLGFDTLRPWIESAQKTKKGLFVLMKTSNPGSGDLQDLEANGQSISQHIADFLSGIETPADTNGYGLIGAVIGATYPEHARQFRTMLPRSLLLVPGIGAQGGDISVLKNFFDHQGLGAIISSSRGITYPFQPGDKNYLTAIENAALETKKSINQSIGI